MRAVVSSLVSGVLFLGACSLATSFDGLAGTAASDGGTSSSEAGALEDAASLDASSVDGGSVGDGAPDPLADGLVGYWRFDETSGTSVIDSSGHGNDGSLVAGVKRVSGKNGSGILTDGTTGYVRIPTSSSLVIKGSMSVTLWANFQGNTLNGDPRLVARTDSWDAKMNSGNPQLSLADGVSYAISSTTVGAGQWHHLAFVFQSATVTIYVDGAATMLGTNAIKPGATLPTGPGDVIVGAYPASPPDAFANAIFDEVRLYDRAISAAEVTALAQ